MNIEFKELQPYNGVWKAWFIADEKDVFIGLSGTLLGIWNIQRTPKIIEMFFRQFGPLKIMEMATKGDVEDYTFVSYDYKKDEETMPLSELEDYLKEEICKTEEEARAIGFKV